jgi:guanylate kinase
VKKGMLFIVSGPSGAGKSTLIGRFLKEDGTSAFSISCTTRERRDREVDGRDYHFVGPEAFERMIENNEFLEWENVHGKFYGTPLKEARATLDKGLDLILDIDVKGALKVKQRCSRACLVFVEPPSTEELVRRLSVRGEKNIALRMKIVEEEMEKKSLFDYTVENNDLEAAYRSFKAVIRRVRRRHNGPDHG